MPLLHAGASAAEASTTFTALLDQEVEKVNDFYMDRIEEGVIILHALKQHAEQMVRPHPAHDSAWQAAP